MAKRGILYMHWGKNEAYKALLERSIASARKWHPELPVHIVTLPDRSTLLDKARMMEETPFDETLFLDSDTVVLARLDYGFEKAVRSGLACAICECPWARRYGGLTGEIVEYNTGVLFFTSRSKPVFELWRSNAQTLDSSIRFMINDQVQTMPLNDQGAFAKAVEDSNFNPCVLPLNWNFRPSWHRSFFGPIKIWHDRKEVPDSLLELNSYHERDDAIIKYVLIQ